MAAARKDAEPQPIGLGDRSLRPALYLVRDVAPRSHVVEDASHVQDEDWKRRGDSRSQRTIKLLAATGRHVLALLGSSCRDQIQF